MAMVNKLIGWLSAGGLVGLFTASLSAPSFLSWYNTPGAGQAMCPCGDLTRETTNKLLWSQAYGALAGGVVLLIVGIVVEVRRRKKMTPAATA